MESGKWIAAAASIWIQSTAGGSYAFSIYSAVLKSTQDYDQATLDTVSVFKDIGANAGVLSGLLYAAVAVPSQNPSPRSQLLRLSRRWINFSLGPWVVHAAGAAQCFLGYFLMWLSVVGVIRRPHVSLMCLFMFLAAHAQTFFNTANVVTAVHNFPDYSGTIVGIMKGFLGLSGAMLIQAYQALFKGNPSTFILMLALLPSLVSLLLMCVVKIYPTTKGEDKKYLNGFSIVALLVAAYLMIMIILENIFTFPSLARIATFILLLLLLSSPLKIATQAQSKESHRRPEASPVEGNLLMHDPLLLENDESLAHDVREYCELSSDRGQLETISGGNIFPCGESMNVLEAMSTLNFWLLFIAMACGMGSGLATINNMSQIGESLGYNTVERNTLVSLWSIWNFLGRFGAGYVSDILLHNEGWARPIFMVVTQATMAAGHAIIASGFSGNLYLGTILVGVCYGSQWSLMPTITSEIFGLQHMGTIFNTIAIASPVGSYFFSVWVIGDIYDEEAGEEKSCSGTHCFMLSFFILSSACVFGSVVALTLFFRTRAFYRSVVLRRLQQCQ
ncbi:hypothetical protein Nepgr_003168 [Nepenthes gracilis]|uniref:Nodulin-like domain-containing protein n=1 Tax=Nepenthes gracilis TaxID=150966 RepID=A0AAD3RYZ5_NEPGR|nr:hypothetical protein Nepgr_003168 [Nepenthes gracilis]